MLAADTQLDIGPGLTSLITRDLHQLADTATIDGGERVVLHNLKFLVMRQEAARVIPAHTQCRLSQVVGTKAEELRVFRDFIGNDRSSRNLDHGADQIVQFHLAGFRDFRGNSMHDLELKR